MNLDYPTNRKDIQALRGYAVLLVVLYHSGLVGLRSGFLGVDIFFVISGFLITGLITRALDNGTFRLQHFYFRRAKRLLPAAYVTLVATTLLAPYFLITPQIKQFGQQVFGALTFSANVVLWKQSGYFDAAAETKPLLHFWSLAVEEQYYLLMPWLLIVLPVKPRLSIIGAVSGASLIYCFTLANSDPSAKFYLLFSRAWELGLGSIGALAPQALRRYSNKLFWPAVATLTLVPVLSRPGYSPDISAFAVCAATLIVILRSYEPISLPVRALAIVGDFSYSLYLVHWPIIVFTRSGYFEQAPPVSVLALAFALAIISGYLLYRGVERPIHIAKFEPSWRVVGGAIAFSLAIGLLPLAIAATFKPPLDYANLRRLNQGLAAVCDQTGVFTVLHECETSDHPKMLVWGDSHAMHLLPGIKDVNGGVMQATRSACAPFLGIAPFDEAQSSYSRDVARKCISFNESVLQYLETNTSITVVVLSAALNLYRPALSLMQRHERGFSEADMSQDTVVAAAKETIDRIRSMGRKVVFVASPPYAGFNIGGCLERRAEGLWSFGKFADCRFSLAVYTRASAPEIRLLQDISNRADVKQVGFTDILCSTGMCEPLADGRIILYLDSSHLTYEGSEYLGHAMNLPSALHAAAR